LLIIGADLHRKLISDRLYTTQIMPYALIQLYARAHSHPTHTKHEQQ